MGLFDVIAIHRRELEEQRKAEERAPYEEIIRRLKKEQMEKTKLQASLSQQDS